MEIITRHPNISKELRKKRSEAFKGERNPNYKDGRTARGNHCIDCGKKIHHTSTRCQSCYGEFKRGKITWMKGKHHTKEAKEKNRLAHLGKRNSPATEFKKGQVTWNKGKKGTYYIKHSASFQKGHIPHNKGIPCSETTRFKISKNRKGKNLGNKSAYVNGKGYEPYTSEFKKLREQIRKRDNYICQKCGKTQKQELIDLGQKLSIHHIDYDKKNCNPENLITLCHNCNIKANFNRGFWTGYFCGKMGVKLICKQLSLFTIGG